MKTFLLTILILFTQLSQARTVFWDANTYDINSLGTLSDTEFFYLKGTTSNIQTQLGLKAPLASPALTGTPTAPTATGGTNTTQVATTAFVTSAVGALVVPDATTGTKGIIQLAGDLGGTAALPTVPALGPHIAATTGVHGLALGSVVGTSEFQTLTNKTITGASIRTPVRSDVKQDTKANLITYATTALNGQLVFATDEKKLYQVIDFLLSDVGSGVGGINFIGSNYNAEDTTTTGWSCFADGATSEPVDGTGGSPNTSISNVASAALAGARHFRMTKNSGASRQGEGCSFDFSVSNAYRVNRVSFPYITSANITDGDYRVYLYDKTLGKVVHMLDVRDIKASTRGTFLGTFQADEGSTDFRLIFITSTTSTTAATFDFDDVMVGPSNVNKGLVGSDWKSYTPADITYGWGTTSGRVFRYRQVGDSFDIEVYLTLSSAVSATMELTNAELLPPGMTVNNSMTDFLGGSARAVDASAITSADDFLGIPYWTGSGLRIIADDDDVFDATSPFVFASGDIINIKLTGVPITGKSSSVMMSEDGGVREIYTRYTGNAGTAVTADVTNIPFTTLDQDKTSSWGGSSFTAPETGTYEFSGSSRFTTSVNTSIEAYKNGTLFIRGGTSAGAICGFTGDIPLVKGDILSFRSTVGGTLLTGSAYHFVAISKKSTPQTLAGGANSVFSSGSNGMVDYQSVFFGTGASCGSACTTGTCTICTQIGTKITSVTWNATGNYRLNGIDGTKYNCLGTAAGAAYLSGYHSKGTSTSSYVDMFFGSAALATNANNISVICSGIP